MAITINLPPEIEESLRRKTADLDQESKEGFVIINYQAGRLSTADVAEILDLETTLEAQVWLAGHGVSLNYSLESLDRDRKSLAELFGADKI